MSRYKKYMQFIDKPITELKIGSRGVHRSDDFYSGPAVYFKKRKKWYYARISPYDAFGYWTYTLLIEPAFGDNRRVKPFKGVSSISVKDASENTLLEFIRNI